MLTLPRITLEVAVESFDEARAAVEAGVDRLELCASLDVDGLTPSLETLEQFRRATAPFAVMVRPRPGNFVYSAREADAMELAIGNILAHGSSGVVFGALTADRNLDTHLCRRLLAAAHPADTVFHRAFDELPEPFTALDQLIDLGFTRVLTSGGGRCAANPACADRIVRLIDRAAGRIEVLPGGGIRPHNVAALLLATNCRQIHTSCRSPDPRGTRLDTNLVRELRRIIDGTP